MERVIQSEITSEDVIEEVSLRPTSLQDYIGQSKIKDNLKVFMSAALKREEVLE